MNIGNKTILSSVAIAVFGYSCLVAHEMPTPKQGSKEFEKLKQLAGNWKGVKTPMQKGEKSDPISIQFKVTSVGSAVEETLGKGTPQEMVDMYTDENGKLAMTHYCAMGNQPHLVLKQSTPNVIALEMGPTIGIDPKKDGHMHSLILEMPDANHLTEKWTSYQDGKPAETAVFTLSRVQ